jgi:dUTP pyrophosphatase
MKLKVKRLNEMAKLPFQTYVNDFCFDVIATSKKYLNDEKTKIEYGTGLAFEIEKDTEGLIPSVCARPRSSIHNTGLILSNSEGTIDYGYIGEVKFVFYKVINGIEYEIGDKIGQIFIQERKEMEIIEVDELIPTERSNKGFGSTGIHTQIIN